MLDNIGPSDSRARRQLPRIYLSVGATTLLFPHQHNAQEYSNYKCCVPTFFAQESGAALYYILVSLIYPTLAQACLTCRKRKLVKYRYFSSTRTPQIASFLEVRCRASALCNMRQVRILAPLGRVSDLTLRQTMACSDQRAASTRIRVSSLSVFCYIDFTSLPPVGIPPNLNAHMIPWRVYRWQPMPIP
jgi:hypothetical protein